MMCCRIRPSFGFSPGTILFFILESFFQKQLNMKWTCLIVALVMTFHAHAQTNTFPSTGSAGIGTTAPNGASLFEMVSTTQGVLFPRMTKMQRDAIASPVNGLIIYQTNSTPGLYYYDGTWKAVTAKGASKFLDNLTAPTAVNVPLLPATSGALDLGSSVKRWFGVHLHNLVFSDGTTQSTAFIPVSITGSGATTVTGSYPNFTISSTDNNTIYTAGDGININGSVINNTMPSPWNNLVGTLSYMDGNVGIGTANPAYLLDVSGDIKVSGIRIGKGGGQSSLNTSVGSSALYANITGSSNTAIGYNALTANTSGNSNTAVGAYAMDSASGSNSTAVGAFSLKKNSGLYNTAVGTSALSSNTTGESNTAVGYLALGDNGAAINNTAVGSSAMRWNTSGEKNTSIGSESLYNNSTGSFNTAAGTRALYTNTTGTYLTAYGFRALYNNSIGSDNAAFGYQSLYNNSSGGANAAVGSQSLYGNTTGEYNTALGYQALYSNTTAGSSVAIGYHALYLSTGASNTSVGYLALADNTSGTGNVAVGHTSGNFNNANTFCTFLGYDADQAVTTDFSNSTAVGNASRITASNQVRIGSSGVTSIGGYTGWTNVSDGRFKKDVKANVPGLEFINKLKPVTYHLDVSGISKFLNEDVSGEGDRETVENAESVTSSEDKEQITYTGFVAQEVETAAKEIGYDFSGIDAPQNENSLYGLRYAEFVVPLVRAVQELAEENSNLKMQNSDLEERMQKVEEMLSLSGNQQAEELRQQTVVLSGGAYLQQNVPNPFDHTTVINYFVPDEHARVQMQFLSISGEVLHAVDLSSGKGSVTVTSEVLPSGTYQYSLIVNGKVIGSRQMIISR
jgi:hypothetical protein